MDLVTLDLTSDADNGAWFTPTAPKNMVDKGIHYRTGDDLPFKIKLAGAHSQRWQDEERRYSDRRLKEITKRGKMPEMTTEEIEERGIKMLACVTLDWEGIEWQGQSAACNETNARTIYRNLKWLREQIDTFVSDPSNFGNPVAEKSPSVFNSEATIAHASQNFTSGQGGVTATAPVSGIR